MFCPQCGMKNEDDALFCQNCGADISQDFAEALASEPKSSVTEIQPPTERAPNEASGYAYQAGTAAVKVRSPVRTSTKVILAVLAVLVVACAVLYNVAKNACSPEKFAQSYFESLGNSDWAKSYSFLDVTESDFINEVNFASVMGKRDASPKIVNYSLDKETAKTAATSVGTKLPLGGLTKTVSIQYTVQGEAEPRSMQIVLIKQPKKQFLLFDTWKVSPADYIAPQVSITVPYGTTAYLNNVKIPDKCKAKDGPSSNSSDASDDSAAPVNYQIKNIFAGTYTLKVTSPYTEDYTQDITAQGSDASASVDSLKLKQSVLDEASGKSEEIIKNIYASALAGKDFSSIKDYFDPSDAVQDNMEQRYKDVLSSIAAGDSDSGFKSVSFSNFRSQAASAPDSSQMAVIVETNFNYSFTAAEHSFYYDSGSPVQERSGNDSGTMDFQFELNNGKWVVSNSSVLTLQSSFY